MSVILPRVPITKRDRLQFFSGVNRAVFKMHFLCHPHIFPFYVGLGLGLGIYSYSFFPR